MSENGPRMTKLKECFKRATKEILNREKIIREEKGKDSFFSEKEIQNDKSDEIVDNLINSVKNKFSHIFKEKIMENNLEFLLNKLDLDIKNKRINYNDIRDRKYIREIFESSIVDEKENILNEKSINLDFLKYIM